MSSLADLKSLYRSGRLILFVGAGVSANLGLPTWGQLIDWIAKELGYEPSIFSTYGSHLALAEYYRATRGSIGPLRSWMDREWHDSRFDIGTSEIHKYIVEGNFSEIYTTNYDRWLELAHDFYRKPYDKIINVGDLVKATNGTRQIIKFHGDFDDDASIVLDETSYFKRLSFESPLDIKLRSDILGKSVLFIGYSLSDINIRLLFYKLKEMWSNHSLPDVRPKSYIFSNKPNPVAEKILSGWGVEMIVSTNDDPKQSLTDFLHEIVR